MPAIGQELSKNLLAVEMTTRLVTTRDALEWARDYDGRLMRVLFPVEGPDMHRGPVAQFNRLQEAGYLRVSWEEERRDDGAFMAIKSIVLTTSGEDYLRDLTRRGLRSRVGARMVELLWIILTTVITTIVTLLLVGKTK
jgi:hypothetical protein